jgi:hypothetical protein
VSVCAVSLRHGGHQRDIHQFCVLSCDNGNMPEPDYDWINQQLDLFIQQTVSHNLSGNGFLTTQSGPTARTEDVIAQAEIAEPILDKFYPEWRTAIETSKTYRWHQHREASTRRGSSETRG